MKDFPVFTTEYGVASLVLKEIPYLQAAYITVRDSLEPEKLLEECVSFCRVCGAEEIFATGHGCLETRPLYTAMWRMRAAWSSLPDTDAALWPVQRETLEAWQRIYNEKVRKVPNGAWMTQKEAQKMLDEGSGYFVHRGETLLGIGMVRDNELAWVASCFPGAGRDVVCALNHAVMTPDVELTVASANPKAVALYESLGFLKTNEISRWYRLQ